jgi:CubicO group peptidase (beta-lactamase class C family)
VSDFGRTHDRLEYELDEGLFTRGAQVVVDVGGERLLDVALGDNGLGTSVTSDHVFRVYCTIKPLLAVLVARLVEDGACALDEPLVAHLPEMRCLEGGVTLRHVMTHTAGLHTLMGVSMEIAPPNRRREIMERIAKPVAWRVGRDAGYSEFAGWQVLGWLVEAVTHEPLRDYMRTRLLEPLGLAHTFIGMTHDEYVRIAPLIGVNCDVRNLQMFPMLYERTERVCADTNPAHGGYTNARDLATFYSALLARRAGDGSDALPSGPTLDEFCTTVREPVFDVVLDRVCPYGLGFMTSLEQHAFGDTCGPASFGHSGNIGTSFAFADPDRDLAVGVVFNGLVSYEAAFLRRRAIVRAIYLDLDELCGPPEDPQVQVPRSRVRLFRRSHD